MNRLNKSAIVNPTFSWTDWELYDTNDAPSIARELNDILKSVVNSGNDRAVVSHTMLMRMDDFSEHGAYDTEPRAFLTSILNEIFGE